MENIEKPTKKFQRSIFNQFLLGILVNVTSIAPSMSLGFSAVALPILKGPFNGYLLNEDQGSWFASMASLATPLGCLIAGPICDKYGRRTAIMTVNVTCFIGWITIASAYYLPEYQYAILLIGRFFTGLSTGLTSMPASLYLAEIVSTHLIGVFTAWSSITFALGVFAIYVLGWSLEAYWGTMALITAVLPCFGMLFAVFLVPESPTWLVSKNRFDDAVDSICKIWKSPDINIEIKEELDRLVKNKAKTSSSNHVQKTFQVKLANKVKYFIRPTCWKPFLIVVAMFFFQQFTGVFSIVFYAIEICKRSGIRMDPYLAICLIGVIRLITTMAASFINRRVGKRPISIVSGTGIAVTMLGLGLFISLRNEGKIGDNWAFVPPVLLSLYFLVSSLGFMIIPFALSAEVYPVKIRGLASALSVCCGYLFNFITVKTYPSTVDNLGIQGVFYIYGIVAIVGTIFSIFVLPETRNKTIQDIEEYFSRNKNKNHTDNNLLEKV